MFRAFSLQIAPHHQPCPTPPEAAAPLPTHTERLAPTAAVLGTLRSLAVQPEPALMAAGLGPTWSAGEVGL